MNIRKGLLQAFILSLTLSSGLYAQRPAGTVIAGATAAGAPVTALLGTGGEVYTFSQVPGVTGLTDYTGTGATVSTLSATSGTAITANTIYINSIHCFNVTGGAITVSRTDTAGNTFEVTKSIAANTDAYLETPGSWTQMVGLKLWASATSSIHCTISAKN